jgi:hypothetical protein
MSTRSPRLFAALSALACFLSGCAAPQGGEPPTAGVPAGEPARVEAPAPPRSPDEALQALPQASLVQKSRGGPTTSVLVTAKDGRFETLGTLIARVKEDGAVPKMRAAFSFEADVTAKMRRELEAMAQAKVEPAPANPRTGFVEAKVPDEAPEEAPEDVPNPDQATAAGGPDHADN